LIWAIFGIWKIRTKYIDFRTLHICLLFISITALLLELPYYFSPNLKKGNFDTIYLIGDSISAGLGLENETTWPKILRQTYSVNLVDLSVPGATCESALHQADKIIASGSLVVLEIGGNDLLGKTKSPRFESDLDALLESVCRNNQTILMFELPLLPLKTEFGRIQRSVANKYQVYLIPKRLFAKILCPKNNTTDGIHLSPQGHQQMADMIVNFLNLRLQ